MCKYYVFEEKPAQLRIMQQFVDQYSQSYYLGEPQIVPNANQSSCFVEKEIDKLLDRRKGICCSEEVIRILAWKMNGINHNESTKDNPFSYKLYKPEKGLKWSEDIKDLRAVNNGNNVRNIERLVHFVIDEENKKKWRSESDEEKKARIILQDLKKCVDGVGGEDKINHIGPVYLITLLYFITSGELPIYDIHAMKSLLAIDSGIAPGNKIEVSQLPSDTSKLKFWDVYYKQYVGLLKTYFGEQYKTNRNIDRALWVYGHLFKAVSPQKSQL